MGTKILKFEYLEADIKDRHAKFEKKVVFLTSSTVLENKLNLMAHCKMEQWSGGHRCMTEPFPGVPVTSCSDHLSMPIPRQTPPELLHTLHRPGQLEPLLYGLWICPPILVHFTPGTPVHYPSEGHVKLLVIPGEIR